MQSQPLYIGSGLNRMAESRADAGWVQRLRDSPDSRFWLMHDDQHLMAGGEPLWVDAQAATTLDGALDPVVLLGIDSAGHAEFVAEIIDPAAVSRDRADLRQIGPGLPRSLGARLAYARAMLGWHRRYRRCTVCGGETRSDMAGHRRQCLAEGCALPQFPRTDPAVIMLVENGEHCLLGRQRHWPQGMHSVLAGFVEPGENLEEAVAREVWEEAGIEIHEIRYRMSQPWPFPASIMLGFSARAKTARLRLRDAELESARWYHRQELLDSPEDERFRLPRADSVARVLIEQWLQA